MKSIFKIIFSFLFLFVLIFSAQIAVYANEQTPWQTNQNGTLYPQTFAWDFTYGYSFTPLKDGQITRLGGFFEGEKTVRLWNKNTGEELSSAVVVGKLGEWHYTSIFPVDVVAETTYIVAAYMKSSGGVYQAYTDPFPQVYGDIVIEAACYSSGDKIPSYFFTTDMLGQVDVTFRDRGSKEVVVRNIEGIPGYVTAVTLSINPDESVDLQSFGIVEYFPEGSKVLSVSHGGVIRQDRIEWIASDFTDLSVSGPRASYEIINEGPNHTYNGTWISVDPDLDGGVIIGETQDD